MLTFLELKRLKQEDQEFEVNLNHTVSKKKERKKVSHRQKRWDGNMG